MDLWLTQLGQLGQSETIRTRASAVSSGKAKDKGVNFLSLQTTINNS